MDADDFYYYQDKEWLQGDIVRDVPHVRYKPPLHALRKHPSKRGPMYQIHDPDAVPSQEPNGGFKFAADTGDDVAASCLVRYGIVLSYDCDLANDPDNHLVAMVRPLPSPPSIEQRHYDNIKANRNANYFYLPAYDPMPDSYVDFRRMSNFARKDFEQFPRLISLKKSVVEQLHLQLFLFITRREVDPVALAKLFKGEPIERE